MPRHFFFLRKKCMVVVRKKCRLVLAMLLPALSDGACKLFLESTLHVAWTWLHPQYQFSSFTKGQISVVETRTIAWIWFLS
jgi:hypothetical protein